MKLDSEELNAARTVEAESFDEHAGETGTGISSDCLVQALREKVLPLLGTVKRALDVGCGDGRFSLVFAEVARSVKGVDPSSLLVAQAQERAAVAGLTRVQFECQPSSAELPAGPFDLVACLGQSPLASGEDEAGLMLKLSKLVERVQEGAWLLTGQPLSLRADAYRAHLRQVGLVPVMETPISGERSAALNTLWLCRRAPAAAGEPQDSAPAVATVVAAAADEARSERADSQALLSRLAEQQDGQSEVLLNIGNFLCDMAERLQHIEAKLGVPAPVDTKPLLARLDRIESTLHWSLRQPRDLSQGPIRVAFLIHHAAAWSSLRGIVDAMQSDPGFEPLVISLPHRFPMLGQMGGESDVHQMLVQQGYPHVRVHDADAEQALERLKQLNPQVVFRQAPWDADVPACLQAQNLAFAKLCYVPYGYMTAKIEKQQFDQNYHRLCWRIFCPDDAHQQLFAGHNLQAGSNCRVTGYPKFDHLLRHRASEGHWPVGANLTKAMGKVKAKTFRLIWAPHFSYEGNWLRFGVFDRMAEQMLALTAAQPQLEVVLRPHPAMREAMAAAPAESFLGQFRDRWQQLPNAGTSNEQEYADLFAASHALLTDGLSFFSEYQLFDKPLVFFEREGHAGFNPAGEQLLDGMYRLRTFGAFQTLLGKLRKGQEDAAIVAARRRIAAAVQPFPGEAARRIVEVIRNEITQG